MAQQKARKKRKAAPSINVPSQQAKALALELVVLVFLLIMLGGLIYWGWR